MCVCVCVCWWVTRHFEALHVSREYLFKGSSIIFLSFFLSFVFFSFFFICVRFFFSFALVSFGDNDEGLFLFLFFCEVDQIFIVVFFVVVDLVLPRAC